MYSPSFVKIPDGGLSGLVELTWNDPILTFSTDSSRTEVEKIWKIPLCTNFSYPYILQEVLFLDQIFEIEFLIKLHVLRTLEIEKHIFNGYSSCM